MGIAALASLPASAAAIFSVNMNTSALVGAGTFQIDFQFIDGSGAPADLNNNTVSISNFNFGTGSATGSPVLFDGASGDLSSTATLHDSQFFNEFTQNFLAGNTLSFQVQLTTNLDPGGVPDEFSFAILDSSGFELPTNGPASEFLDIAVDSSNPLPLVFGSVETAEFPIGAPSATSNSAMPEPDTASVVAAALLLLSIRRLRRSA